MGSGVRLLVAALLWGALSSSALGATIPEAKLLPDSGPVTLTQKTVTYVSPDFFYVEESSRACGLRVEKAGHSLSVGAKADVAGTMQTSVNNERYIAASSVSRNGNGVVAPVTLSNRAVGGADWRYDSHTRAGQKGAAWSKGLNNVGLLVKVCGRFERIDANTFLLDDGAGLYVKCTIPPGLEMAPGMQYVAVTGISSIYKLNATTYPPVILARSVDVLLPSEVVTTPGSPKGNAYPKRGVEATYTTTGSTGSQGSTIEYCFDWGDGTKSPWTTQTSASHAWTDTGTKSVTVTARSRTRPGAFATSAPLAVNVQIIEMVYVPGGTFLMGNSGVGDDFTCDKQYGLSQEKPQHQVTLQGFWIGKYEVTRGEYREFINAGGYANSAYWSTNGWSWRAQNSRTEPTYWTAQQNWGSVPGAFTQTDNYPVVGVSYYEAEAFCNWAGVSLPTEAQWEMAARWNVDRANVYPWGNIWDASKCNCWDDALYPGSQTAPVGSYTSGASPYGCQDMAGNGWEWVQDWYKSYPGSSSPFDETGSTRCMRGGGFNSRGTYGYCRCANRYGAAPTFCWNEITFRVAR